MPVVTRSKRNKAAVDIDQLSGLLTGMNITSKSKSKKTHIKKERKDTDLADMFSGLTLGKSIRKTRRHKGLRFAPRKSHKTRVIEPDMDTYMDMGFGGRKRRRTHRRR